MFWFQVREHPYSHVQISKKKLQKRVIVSTLCQGREPRIGCGKVSEKLLHESSRSILVWLIWFLIIRKFMSFGSWVDLHVWSYISWRKKIEIILILSFDSFSLICCFGLSGFCFLLECSWEDLSNSRDFKVEKLYYATTIFHFLSKKSKEEFCRHSFIHQG